MSMKLQAEVNQLKKRVEELEKMIQEMQKPGVGRPRKVA